LVVAVAFLRGLRVNAFAFSTILQVFAQQIVLDCLREYPYSDERAKVSAAPPGYFTHWLQSHRQDTKPSLKGRVEPL